MMAGDAQTRLETRTNEARETIAEQRAEILTEIGETAQRSDGLRDAASVPDHDTMAAVLARLAQGWAPESPQMNPGAMQLKRIDFVPAIMDEGKLPKPPGALIGRVLPEGGKMVVTGAPKTWKSFLAVQLAIAVATGGEWLGEQCRQSKVLYVNLEIDDPQFMRRVYDTAHRLGASAAAVEGSLRVSRGIGSALTTEQMVDAILSNPEAQGCGLVIVDPIYKVFSGSENAQDDMAEFCRQIDRLARGVGCAVVAIHHQSKGYQGCKDMADRGSGSGVLARDVDALIDVSRIEGESAMRASFLLRAYPEHKPVEYTFEYPACILDTAGKLRDAKFTHAHSNGHARNRAAATLAKIEAACEMLLADSEEVNRTDVAKHLNMKGGTISKHLQQSKRFVAVSGKNQSIITRRGREA